MKLRGIPFGPVFNASGSRNFFGQDGWWFHNAFNILTAPLRGTRIRTGLHYEGCTFVAKTTTCRAREGNMPLIDGTTTPKELIPKCIIPVHRKRVVLNKVGLSGPGMQALLDRGIWQSLAKPFVLSFMATGRTREDRREETGAFARLLAERLIGFLSPVALQVNFSCPNVELQQEELMEEVLETLDLLANILPDVPLLPKFSALLRPMIACMISRHPACDAIVMSNTIPWGKLQERINWVGIFGSMKSPLAHIGGEGGGGLSGAPLLPIVLEWIAKARRVGLTKPIIAGGGILDPADVQRAKHVGASGVEVGSASILCPWNVQPIIDEGRRVFA